MSRDESRIARRTASSGRANRDPPVSRTSAVIAEIEIGTQRSTATPRPRWLVSFTSPLSSATVDRSTSRPTPRPAISVTASVVVTPLSRTRRKISSGPRVSALAAVITPRATAARRTESGSIPRPSSEHTKAMRLPRRST